MQAKWLTDWPNSAAAKIPYSLCDLWRMRDLANSEDSTRDLQSLVSQLEEEEEEEEKVLRGKMMTLLSSL